ncbi:hypothetical protein [Burkholderia sp. MSMB0856]|uniref:hypothetical protein n=1 Tax=Burkholderia sp. MSMB0856 TaxID=1637869 RepID=UPI000A4B0DB0|nr:hypothetical protein [Burkholderia sp. MSMB0856]
MPTALIAGLPAAWMTRVKSSLAKCEALPDDWKITYLQGRNSHYPCVSDKDVAQILSRAAEGGGTHVIGISSKRDREQISRQVLPFFRFRWLDPEPFEHQQDAEIQNGVVAALTEEDAWRRAVMPTDKNSPLLLPQTCFTTKIAPSIWDEAAKWGDKGQLVSAQKQLNSFKQAHSKRVGGNDHPYWVDLSDRKWDYNGAPHGAPPAPRGWKYSFSIPDGFHFDVTHKGDKEFTFTDCTRKLHSVKGSGWLNVDAHGFVRGE